VKSSHIIAEQIDVGVARKTAPAKKSAPQEDRRQEDCRQEDVSRQAGAGGQEEGPGGTEAHPHFRPLTTVRYDLKKKLKWLSRACAIDA
jgi:hypothetical protein